MEQTTLKYLRIFIPGLMFLLGTYPIYIFYYGEVYDVKTLHITYVTLLSVLVGSLYHYLNVRMIVTYLSHKCINENISDQLIKLHDKNLSREKKSFIKEDNKYMDVFYEIIDNNESLKKKSKNIYFNGVFWTSTADLLILSLFFGFLYLIFFSNIPFAKDLYELFFTISFLSIILHVLAVNKHIKLSNEQLNFISNIKRKEVKKLIDDILHNMPQTGNKKGQTNDKNNPEGVSKK